MPEKEGESGENLELKWLRYLIAKSKEQDEVISELKAELEEIKGREEILGKSLLEVLENAKK